MAFKSNPGADCGSTEIEVPARIARKWRYRVALGLGAQYAPHAVVVHVVPLPMAVAGSPAVA